MKSDETFHTNLARFVRNAACFVRNTQRFARDPLQFTRNAKQFTQNAKRFTRDDSRTNIARFFGVVERFRACNHCINKHISFKSY